MVSLVRFWILGHTNMRIKLLFLIICFCSTTWAQDNHHLYPVENQEITTKKQVSNLKYPGYCEIEIINNSYTNIRVRGIFDDGEILRSFRIYSYEYPHYISLYYYGYCHYGMDIFIETLRGYRIYSGYTTRGQTIYVEPYMMVNQPQAKIKSK
jgi:hypothetical protein